MNVGETLVDAEVDAARESFFARTMPRIATSRWIVRQVGADGLLCDRRDTGRRVIASISREFDGEIWLHASISRRDRELPTYHDLVEVQRVFVDPAISYQLFVPLDEHIDHAEVLHLWSCLTKRVTPDFSRGSGHI